MKAILSLFGVLSLCISVALFGVAANAGSGMAYGTVEMVICSGAGTVTITLDANGAPVPADAPMAACCDCQFCNTTCDFDLHTAFHAAATSDRFTKVTVLAQHQMPAPLMIARPQARGPPPEMHKIGSFAVLCCGLVFKDTTV